MAQPVRGVVGRRSQLHTLAVRWRGRGPSTRPRLVLDPMKILSQGQGEGEGEVDGKGGRESRCRTCREWQQDSLEQDV